MGHKKRIPAPRSKPTSPAPAGSDGPITVDDEPGQNQSKIEARSDASIKIECERALTALRRGNHTKALKLMKEACLRYESSALLHRVQGTVSVKVASLIDDPNAKQRHIKNAVESAQRAVALSPNSIEFAHFYANLLCEVSNDSKGYEEAVQECERALSIENPIDPVKESLQEESQMRVSTPEARIANLQQELRSLIQKSNIASISAWMKNLGNVGGEDKFRLVPMKRLTEDPMEASLVQSRRPNEIKKAMKTPEERRMEIQVRVAAARLLQQKLDLPQLQNDEDRAVELASATHRLGERRKYASMKKIVSSVERMDQVRSYWNSTSIEKKRELLQVRICNLREHFGSSKDGLIEEVLSEAIAFAGENKSWKFWGCCSCGEKFTECELLMQHLMRKHIGNLSPKLQSVVPQEVDSDWVEMLVNGVWKPVDTSAAVKIIENQSNSQSSNLVDRCYTNNNADECKDCSIEYTCHSGSKEGNAQQLDEESEKQESGSQNAAECGIFDEISNFEVSECDGKGWPISELKDHKWPLCDDTERAKILERIHGMFQLLLRHKYLAVSHLNKVIQYTMEELQVLIPASQLLIHGLDQTPLCICLLGASQLKKILAFLQELAHSCGLSRYSEKGSSTDDALGGNQGFYIKEKIVLTGDLSCLLLDERLLRGELAPGSYHNAVADDGSAVTVAVDDHEDDVLPHSDALISWLFAGHTSGEQLASWTRIREDKKHQGMEVFNLLDKEFYILQSICEIKCEHLNYEEAFKAIESICLKELKKREQVAKFVPQSYESLLRKRQEELVEMENDAMFNSCRIELDCIANVLNQAQALNVNQFGFEETLTGVTSRLCDLECGEDDEWRMQDYLRQADTCIEVAIQRQKERLSIEHSKTDVRIMKSIAAMQQLELKLAPISAHDYRSFMLPLLKSFLRAHLEDLADKDATEKSDAAREALLAELALDAKKNTNRRGDPTKQIQEKSKDKKKSKDNRKAKDLKVSGGNEQLLLHQEDAELDHFPVAYDGDYQNSQIGVSVSADELKQQEEELRHKFELEAEERKLEETLEYQRRIENEAKQKLLAEHNRKLGGSIVQNVVEGIPIIDSKPSDNDGPRVCEQLRHCRPVTLPGSGGYSDSHNRTDVGGSNCQISLSSGNQNVEWDDPRECTWRPDALLNSGVDKMLSSYDDNFHQELPVDGTGMPKDLSGIPVNTSEEIMAHIKSSSPPCTQRNRRRRSHSHGKFKQGLPNRGAPEDGVLSSDQLTGRQGRLHYNSLKSHDQNSGASSADKEKLEVETFQVEGCTKLQNLAQDNVHGSNRLVDPFSGHNGRKTLRQLHTEEDDEERFQVDLKKAVCQSLDTFQVQKNFPLKARQIIPKKMSLGKEDFEVLPPDATVNDINGSDVFGTGLRNDVGEYNCFLNVIIQSLWHLRRFRDEFLNRSTSMHAHVGDPCVVCALHDIFTALSTASTDMQGEAVAPTSLRIALSNLYPDSNFFQEAQMNDASEVLGVIFDCLHQSFTPSLGISDTESEESNCMGSWDCGSSDCLAHSLFGMNIFEKMNCYNCGLESRHLKYTSFFHNINASALRTMKIMCADSSFDEILKLVEMNHQLACDPETGGCGRLNYTHHILSTPPYVFTTVLGWQTTCESMDDISATLTALTTEIYIGVLYRGSDPGNRHRLVSVVCYYGQHYHCFAYSHNYDRWIMYDDNTVKVIGHWDDVLTMCEKGHLQPQVLFFEAAK